MSHSTVETVNTSSERIKFWGAVVLAVAAVIGFYQLERQGVWVQWGVLLGGFALAAVLYFTSESGRWLAALLRDAWRELKKVSWPGRREATTMTLYVFAFVLVMAIVLWLTDKSIEWLLYDLVLGWRK